MRVGTRSLQPSPTARCPLLGGGRYCQPYCQPNMVRSGPQWPVLTPYAFRVRLFFLILFAGEGVGLWPPEPKATGSNPVGRAIHYRIIRQTAS